MLDQAKSQAGERKAFLMSSSLWAAGISELKGINVYLKTSHLTNTDGKDCS